MYGVAPTWYLVEQGPPVFHVMIPQSSKCTPTTVTVGKELPKLPDQFQTHIEHNFKSSIENFTEEYDEYYDFTNDRGSVIRYRDSKKERQYFLYKTNELISITGRVE